MPTPVAASHVLLFGSASTERRVSVASAQFVARWVDARLWFWAPDGGVLEVSRAELDAHQNPFTSDFCPGATHAWSTIDIALNGLTPGNDVVILAVHGGHGEDGDLQRRLEQRGLAFTGSGSLASARAFNKSEALALAHTLSIRTSRGCAITANDAQDARRVIDETFATLGPMVVKAESGGLSIGMTFVRSAADCARAVELLVASPRDVFRAEQIIEGREFTVGVIEHEGGELALPCSEIVMHPDRAFDYDGKYLGAGSTEITPAQLTAELREQLHANALAIHKALGCEGYSRSDFIADARGPVYLETNTLPGLTGRSFIPQQLEAAGIPFKQFLRDQIAIAVARRDRAR